MANTRQSAKRARQAVKKQGINTIVRGSTRTAVSKAIDSIQSKDLEKAKLAYIDAVKALASAASKGAIPRARAARKISRLTLMAKKFLPAATGKAAK